jgi:hypothetical protein
MVVGLKGHALQGVPKPKPKSEDCAFRRCGKSFLGAKRRPLIAQVCGATEAAPLQKCQWIKNAYTVSF